MANVSYVEDDNAKKNKTNKTRDNAKDESLEIGDEMNVISDFFHDSVSYTEPVLEPN